MDIFYTYKNLKNMTDMSDVDFYYKYLQSSSAWELQDFLELCPCFLNESIVQDPFDAEIDTILQHMSSLFETLG